MVREMVPPFYSCWGSKEAEHPDVTQQSTKALNWLQAAGCFSWLEQNRCCAWKRKVFIPSWAQMTWLSWDPAAMTSKYLLFVTSKCVPCPTNTLSTTIQGKDRLFYETDTFYMRP